MELTNLPVAGSGVVYTWGRGANGRLGHGDDEDVLSPRRIASLQRVVGIAAGWEHALALTGVWGRCVCVCDDCFSGGWCVRVGQWRGWQTRCG